MTLATVWKFYVKEILKRWEFWVLAVMFTIFWQSTGAYVFADYSFPPETWLRLTEEMRRKIVHSYTGSWYGFVALFMLSFMAITFVQIICHSVVSVRYLSKYSKASTLRFFTGLMLATLTAIAMATVFLLTSTVLFYSQKFYDLKELVVPQNYLGILATTVAGGLFAYFLSMTLAMLVIVLRRPRMLSAMCMAPVVLAFGLGYTANYAGGVEIQALPFGLITRLGEHYYSGIPIDLTRPGVQTWMAWLRGQQLNAIDPFFAWLIMLGWIALLALTSMLLLRKQRGINVEELMG